MNDEPAKPLSNSDRFRRMAEAIDHNTDSGFGGAFVIVAPEGGNPLETLILDAGQDHMQFWILLRTKCDVEIKRLDTIERQGAFRR